MRFTHIGDHTYEVATDEGEHLGRVQRVGSLPSCQKWYASEIRRPFRTRALAACALHSDNIGA